MHEQIVDIQAGFIRLMWSSQLNDKHCGKPQYQGGWEFLDMGLFCTRPNKTWTQTVSIHMNMYSTYTGADFTATCKDFHWTGVPHQMLIGQISFSFAGDTVGNLFRIQHGRLREKQPSTSHWNLGLPSCYETKLHLHSNWLTLKCPKKSLVPFVETFFLAHIITAPLL